MQSFRQNNSAHCLQNLNQKKRLFNRCKNNYILTDGLTYVGSEADTPIR